MLSDNSKLREELWSLKKESSAKDIIYANKEKEQEVKESELVEQVSVLKSELDESALTNEKLHFVKEGLNKEVCSLKAELLSNETVYSSEIRKHELRKEELEHLLSERKKEILEIKLHKTLLLTDTNNKDKESTQHMTTLVSGPSDISIVNSGDDETIRDIEFNKEAAEKLKNKVSDLEKEFDCAGPSEILRRCCKTFEFDVKFSIKIHSNDPFVCTIKLKENCSELDHYMKKDWGWER